MIIENSKEYISTFWNLFWSGKYENAIMLVGKYVTDAQSWVVGMQNFIYTSLCVFESLRRFRKGVLLGICWAIVTPFSQSIPN